MWKYQKKLQYPINIKRKDLNMAKLLVEQYGGANCKRDIIENGVDIMSNCINLRKKMNRTFYCKKKLKQITLKNCTNCQFKEYKTYKSLKKRTYKHIKKEKDRFSIIYNDLTKCCNCGSKIGIELNEIYEGSYRRRSIEYGTVAPMCYNCHTKFHHDSRFNLYYKVLFEKEFLKTHSKEEFIKTFGQDYIFKLRKKDS